MSPDVINLRQFLLGADPYVVIQITGGEMDAAGEEVESVKLDVQFGGGLDQESMFELLAQIVAEQADEDAASLEDTIAKLRESYELKVADLARETKRVEILAKVLREDNHSPDGFHAEGDRCRQCKALREALRPDSGEVAP